MQICTNSILPASVLLLASLMIANAPLSAKAQADASTTPKAQSRSTGEDTASAPESVNYRRVQARLAQGWNTWDVHSVTTQVLLPEGLAIHVGLKHNSTEGGDAFLQDALIGRLTPGAEQVFPGPHAWDGSYTDLRITWNGHSWRVQSARDGSDLILLANPLPSTSRSALPPTIVFSVDFLWNRPGTALRNSDFIETRGASGMVPVYCTCTTPADQNTEYLDLPIGGPYFAADLIQPVGVSTGKRRTLAEIETAMAQHEA
ncbi:MAG: hypothetical protein WCA11_00980, partial [Terracidiphilus sp.]